MLTVISVMSLLLSGAAVALHGMYRANSAARTELESGARLARLSGQFRADVRAAQSAEVKDRLLDLRLSADRRIAYEAATGRVNRTVYQQDQVEHRDTFRLAPDMTVRWEAVKRERADMLSACVERTRGMAAQIDSRLAADHRFEAGATE
jgi:type II secretory pathway component PulJ